MKKGISIFVVYVVFAVIVSFIWSIYAKDEVPVTLSNFLEYLSKVPTISLENMSLRVFVIEDKWASIVDWVRRIINVFGVFLGLIRFFAISVYNIFVTLLYFINYVFSGFYSYDSSFAFDDTTGVGAGSGFGGGGSSGR